MLTALPLKISAGDTLTFTQSASDFPAGSGWTLRYTFQGSGGVFTISSVPSGNDHLFQISSAATAAWAAGSYGFTCYASSATERVTLLAGSFTVLVNPATATAADTRSFNQRMLEALQAALEGTATKEQLRITVDGTQIEYKSGEELLKLYVRFRQFVAEERAAQQVSQGRTGLGKLRVRL